MRVNSLAEKKPRTLKKLVVVEVLVVVVESDFSVKLWPKPS